MAGLGAAGMVAYLEFTSEIHASMHAAARPDEPRQVDASGPEAEDEIRSLVEESARLLPTQGPIDVFVAQNILQGFEPQPFDQAVLNAARIYGAEPFLPESLYREELARGRIRRADLEAVVAADIGERGADTLAGGRISLHSLLLTLLEHPVRQEDDVAVRWTLTESPAFEGHESLWHACMEAVSLFRPALVHVRPPVRPRDLVVAADPALDTDALVHPLLIRLCGAFVDQGIAAWPMPGRDRGFLEATARLFSTSAGPTEPWSGRLPAALAAVRGRDPFGVIAAEIGRLGVPATQRGEMVERTLLALRGWAGMMRQLEIRPDRTPVTPVPARLADFLAVRLVLDRVALEWVAGRLGHSKDTAALWTELRDRYPARRGPGTVARAYLMCQVARLVGLSAHEIRSLDENELMRFELAIQGFDAISRRRLFHLAYERRHRIGVLDALASHVAVAAEPSAVARPALQAVFCMDERCESFRRHFEELDWRFETFGTAGFFAVPMYYRGLDDWHATPLCPVVMRPQHTVVEVPEEEALGSHRLRQAVRRQLGQLQGSVSSSHRTLFRGSLLSAVGGAIAAVPLVARVVFPRLAGNLARVATDLGRNRIRTHLEIERVADQRCEDGTRAGFDVAEMAAIVRRVIEDVGFGGRFARLVAVLGHGSTSLNNPHESAYDCGACGGGRGGPNARAFAAMANDPRVRELLAAAGLQIPADTWFVAGMQDTCSNAVVFYDTGRVPTGHAADLRALQSACDEARTADAHERCRRFDSVPLGVTPAEALRRVEGRANDLAQVRPELGHATNAVCVIGRRWRTRGLFLDRRSFLVSYDPESDPDGQVLSRILAAVGPVGAGINLAYNFSRIDPVGYGCGTKLPHNITGLIGVMDGHASDLRTGLPWQTVEIHEPVRLLVVVDAAPDRIMAAAARVPVVQQLVSNHWVQLAAWHLSTPGGSSPGELGDGGLGVFCPGGFQAYRRESTRIPVVQRSRDWYAGHRGHLPPARVLAGLTARAEP
jgi:uncharacterized protein YbcC (UPF0753/DUF2309 family)